MLVQREQSIRGRWEQMSRNALPNNTSAAEQQVFKAIDLWAQNSGVAHFRHHSPVEARQR